MLLSPDAEFSFAVDPDARLALACMGGTLTGPDMTHIVNAVHGDPAWEPSFDVIWDCSRVDAHVVSPGEETPVLEALSDEHAGRDLIVQGPGLSGDVFATMLVFRARRLGDAASSHHSVEEAVAALGRDALPARLRRVRQEVH